MRLTVYCYSTNQNKDLNMINVDKTDHLWRLCILPLIKRQIHLAQMAPSSSPAASGLHLCLVTFCSSSSQACHRPASDTVAALRRASPDVSEKSLISFNAGRKAPNTECQCERRPPPPFRVPCSSSRCSWGCTSNRCVAFAKWRCRDLRLLILLLNAAALSGERGKKRTGLICEQSVSSENEGAFWTLLCRGMSHWPPPPPPPQSPWTSWSQGRALDYISGTATLYEVFLWNSLYCLTSTWAQGNELLGGGGAGGGSL